MELGFVLIRHFELRRPFEWSNGQVTSFNSATWIVLSLVAWIFTHFGSLAAVCDTDTCSCLTVITCNPWLRNTCTIQGKISEPLPRNCAHIYSQLYPPLPCSPPPLTIRFDKFPVWHLLLEILHYLFVSVSPVTNRPSRCTSQPQLSVCSLYRK